MARGGSLLERLARTSAGVVADSAAERAELMASIMRNLQNVLNTRQGSAPAQMDLGIPPPNEIAQDYPASLERLTKSIREGIARYEPRLSAIEVAFIETPGEPTVLNFQVSARLAGERSGGLTFRTLVNANGRVAVRGQS